MHAEGKTQKQSFVKNHYLIKLRAMSNKEVWDFSEKLKRGLELAEQRMLQEKALRDEDIIVSSDGKTIQRIPAKELIAETTTM